MQSALAIAGSLILLAATSMWGTNLNIAVQTANGNSSVNMNANGTLDFRVVGTLFNANNNDGLALWAADLTLNVDPDHHVAWSNVTYGSGSCNANTFNCNGMGCFATPCGINNPAGYGGTPYLGDLLQVGGAQNTIKNGLDSNPLVAPAPRSEVAEGIGQSQVTLATGSLTLHSATPCGTYTLAAINTFANVIQDGQVAADGEYYRTEPAGLGTNGTLSINVAATLTITSADPPAVSPYIPAQRFRDVLQTGTTSSVTQGIGASGTPAQDSIHYATISVSFSDTPDPAPSTSTITVSCTGGTCPTLSSVSGSGTGPYTLTLSGVIPTKECTTITFDGAPCEKLQYQYLPGDVNLNGVVGATDILALVTAINNGQAAIAANKARYNINRSGSVTASDVLRLVGLLNGLSTTQAWLLATVTACP